MKITVLGSGTCASQLPGIANRFPPGFLAEWDDQKILFECSEGIRFRLEQAGHNYAAIQHIAISHSHPDHNALVHYAQSVFCYGLWGDIKNEQLNVYAPVQLIADFPTLWKMYMPERLDGLPNFVLNFKPAAEAEHQIGSGKLSAVKVHHGRGLVDAVAFRLETPDGIFVYSGDTGVCDGIREIIQDADLFICDATARIGDEQSPIQHGHLNPRITGEISQEAGVKTLVLTHHTGLDSDAAMIEDCKKSGFTGSVVVAKDFQEITV